MTFDNDTILSILHTIFIKTTIEDTNRIIENNTAILPVTEKCLSSVKKYVRENLNNTMDVDYAYYYLQKFVWDSSKNKNDVTSFGECLRKPYNQNFDNETIRVTNFLIILLKLDENKNNDNNNTECSNLYK